MKKINLFLLLACILVIAWCSMWKKTTNNQDTNVWSWDTQNIVSGSVKWKYSFDNKDCQTYVKLMECLIDKTPEAAKNQTISSFEKVMQLWKWLDASTLPSTCKNTIEMLQNQKEVFAKAGCNLE